MNGILQIANKRIVYQTKLNSMEPKVGKRLSYKNRGLFNKHNKSLKM